MKPRKLLIALVATALCAVWLGALAHSAAAEKRTLIVTLVGGKSIVVTVDVPAGTPLSQIKLPDLHLPILSITDATPQQPAAPVLTPPSLLPPKTSPSHTAPGQAPAKRPARKHAGGKAQIGAPQVVERQPARLRRQPLRQGNGAPTKANPTFSLALPGPAAIGVPDFFIDKFRIPPFLLPIYQAAGIEYSVPWQILAAINEIETDYGRNLSVSSAGAVGWMQFLPSSWKRYGVDANNDGRRDPYNPVDAIFAAGRYLRAAGVEQDVKRAIFAYNHADWYVASVLLRAKLIGGLPADLVGSLTGLTQGHFPVAAKATYADDINEAQAAQRTRHGNAALTVEGTATRRAINIFARRGAPVIAVNDGVIKKVGHSKRLGNFIVLQDVYGNRYTYSQLGKVAPSYPAPKPKTVSASSIRRELKLPRPDAAPSAPASAGVQRKAVAAVQHVTDVVRGTKDRLFAHPARPRAFKSGGEEQLLTQGRPVAGYATFESYFKHVLGLQRDDVVLKPLKTGARVIAGTILGRIDKTSRLAPHVNFQIRPAGRGAPRIDPKPILDGWKLLESTAIYRAAGKNPFFGPDAETPTIGQILLMSKEQLERRVLADPRVQIYDCGRRDIQAGAIDRRVLATLEFLSSSGFKPTVTALECGHSYYTKSGNVSEHSSGNAVDIAAINGIPILGHQGKGSIAELVVRRLLTLQGTMKPHQIISLMTFEGTDNTFAMGDHADHIHVGFRPLYGTNSKLARQFNAILKPGQWIKLIDRLNQIDNPVVPIKPSRYALAVKRARTHGGE